MDMSNTFAKLLSIGYREGAYVCPHGCSGRTGLRWGLVSHLMNVHGYSQKKAEKKVDRR